MSDLIFLSHSGTPQMYDFDPNGSGRYRQGSGKNPHQHDFDLYYEVQRYKKDFPNMTNDEIYKALGYESTGEARAKYAYQREQVVAYNRARAIRMRNERQMSATAIARELGVTEGTVRNWLKDSDDVKDQIISNTANTLKDLLNEYPYLDVGEGTASRLGISQTKLDAALQSLKDEGYVVHPIQVNQINPKIKGQKTTMLILGPPGKTENEQAKENYAHLEDIHYINEYYSEDNGLTWGHMEYPRSVDSKRIQINYADKDGFQPKDGVIELRPGVEDLSLGPNQVYSQVRIMVDDKYYMKGMAIYSNDLPPGIDIRFNTNKKEGAPLEKVFKPLKRTRELPNGDPDPTAPIDKDNPFGATIVPEEKGGQRHYIDSNGVKQLSCINKVNPEGSWEEWDKALASQFLSKQPNELAKAQLNISYLKQVEDYEAIKAITNPVVRKKELLNFADSCDEASADLKAWAMPRQSNRVLLPLSSLKEDECYCPDYKNGEKLVLIRYPHSGPTEILEVKVNNNNKDGQRLFGKTPRDVIAINPKMANKLSGADFDGDSVVVIPNNKGQIISKDNKHLEFDPKIAYPGYEGLPKMTDRTKGIEMGKAANLITDMYIKGASERELEDAIKYSMVVVDAQKHHLDWKSAQKDFHISQYRKEYQGNSQGGASTIISRSKGPEYVPERRLVTGIDPETGDKITYDTHNMMSVPRELKDGTIVWDRKEVKTKSKKMYEVKDAYDLVSDRNNPYPIEAIYADYANQMKDLARDARKESLKISKSPKNNSASKAYSEEVESLTRKLQARESEGPSDRAALRAATVKMNALKAENPNMSKEQYKKRSAQALSTARTRVFVGGKKEKINITEKEWEAIEAHAISDTMLEKILRYADEDQILSYAAPKKTKGNQFSQAQIARMKALAASNYWTWSDIAEEFGVSESTIKRYVNG